MKKYREYLLWLFGILIILGLIIFLGYLWIIYSLKERDKRLMQEGEELAHKVELFRSVHHRLPGSEKELGMEELGGRDVLYYEVWDSTTYIIYFTASFGDGFDVNTYDSKTKQWTGFIRK